MGDPFIVANAMTRDVTSNFVLQGFLTNVFFNTKIDQINTVYNILFIIKRILT